VASTEAEVPFCEHLTGTSRMFCAPVLAAGVTLRRYGVTNAVLHACGPITVSANYLDGILRVEVHDTERTRYPTSGSHRPRTRPDGDSTWSPYPQTDGRCADPAGKTIWFEIT
jgi:hypothetical protein